MTSFGKETRDQVLELLKVVYPTGYAEVMDLVVKTLRQEIWEYRWGYSNETPTAGTMGVRYIDGREVYIVMRNDLANLTIHIKDKGVVNPVVSQPWPQETVDYWTYCKSVQRKRDGFGIEPLSGGISHCIRIPVCYSFSSWKKSVAVHHHPQRF